jgi:hypothetical protein
VVAEVLGDDDVGPVTADCGGDVAAQRQPLDDATVGVAEELDARHADGGTGRRRRQRVDARLPGRDQHVRHLLAGRSPRGDGTGDAPLDVVGVGDDHRRRTPSVRERRQGHRSALRPPSTTSVWPVT